MSEFRLKGKYGVFYTLYQPVPKIETEQEFKDRLDDISEFAKNIESFGQTYERAFNSNPARIIKLTYDLIYFYKNSWGLGEGETWTNQISDKEAFTKEIKKRNLKISYDLLEKAIEQKYGDTVDDNEKLSGTKGNLKKSEIIETKLGCFLKLLDDNSVGLLEDLIVYANVYDNYNKEFFKDKTAEVYIGLLNNVVEYFYKQKFDDIIAVQASGREIDKVEKPFYFRNSEGFNDSFKDILPNVFPDVKKVRERFINSKNKAGNPEEVRRAAMKGTEYNNAILNASPWMCRIRTVYVLSNFVYELTCEKSFDERLNDLILENKKQALRKIRLDGDVDTIIRKYTTETEYSEHVSGLEGISQQKISEMRIAQQRVSTDMENLNVPKDLIEDVNAELSSKIDELKQLDKFSEQGCHVCEIIQYIKHIKELKERPVITRKIFSGFPRIIIREA